MNLDTLIYATAVLFILSVITEKLTHLVRLYPRQVRYMGISLSLLFYIPIVRELFIDSEFTALSISVLLVFNTFSLIVLFANTETAGRSRFRVFNFLSNQLSVLQSIHKNNTLASEEVKEKEITVLSFFAGFIVAYVFNANLFKLFKPNVELGWGPVSPFLNDSMYALNPDYFGFELSSAMGFTFTAFFLSFGSKFFHDLLDTLFQAKNLKKKLNEEEISEIEDIKHFDDYITLNDSDRATLAISQNEKLLRSKFPNIKYINDSIAVLEGKRTSVVGIYLSDSNTKGLPDKLPAVLPGGKTIWVKTEIVKDLGVASVSGGIDGALANSNSFMYKGSACCMVYNEEDEHFLLTNCHVLTNGALRNPLYDTNEDEVLYNDEKVGVWTYGTMNPKGDFALVKLEDAEGFTDSYDVPVYNGKTRTLTKDDWLHLQVSVCGRKSATDKAYILEVMTDQLTVAYDYGHTLNYETAILIGSSPDKQNCYPVNDFGDSGGAVYIKDQLIGIIIAKDARFTYAIPVNEFLQNLKLKIK